MSKTAGTAGQAISLPKGGGALQGMGEKFSPDMHSGTGNFTVPLALPAGRNNFQPELNLVYSTGHGAGPFGLGWSLSLPRVARQTSKGVPRYDDAQDIFIFSGAEDLVPIPGGRPGTTRYRPRTEGLFAHIEHHHDAANDCWEVRSQDGLVSLYGTAEAAGSDPATVADPVHRRKIFAWNLTQTADPFGNRIVYEYERDTDADGPHHWDQLYLRRIRYVDYVADGQTQFLVSVTFIYNDRPDPYSEFRSGFEIRTRRRCSRLEVRTHADAERLVRTYHLIYVDQRAGTAHLLPHNGVSLLSQVKVLSHDGDRAEELPPLEFDYTRFSPEDRKFSSVQGAALPGRSLANADLELVDLFGQGLPDILETNSTVRYWRNLGGGEFDRPREMRDAPAGFHLSDAGVQMLDADGDGRTDLLVTQGTLSGYFPLRFGGLWDRHSFQPYRRAPSFNLEDPEVRLLDLDGDGVTDAMRSGTRLECYFNDPQEGWNSIRLIERRGLEEFPNVNFSDPRVRIADMSGDGLQDIVLIYDGCVEYWPALGRGDWAKRITMRQNPRFPYGYDPRRILLGDVDGDGLADIVYVDDGKVTLWVNQGGDRWSSPIEITGTPRVSNIDAVRLVDLYGSGISGVLWSADANGQSRTNLCFLDFSGGVKPYLLNKMDNHMGAITRVAYASSTQFYLEDEQRPETRWKTSLPFPVQVVARVEVIDAVSGGKLTSEYRYHHGYWDGAEREFRGFGRVDRRDTEVFEDFHQAGLHPTTRGFTSVTVSAFSPPTETRTWFHQGPIGDEFGDWEEIDYAAEFWPGDPPALARPQALVDALPALPRRARRDALRALRGSVLRTELYALDGTARQDRPYTVTESLYGTREETPPGPGEEERRRIFFPHKLAQRTTQWERGHDPMTQFSFTVDYDVYGQPRAQIVMAVPRGRDFRVAAAPGKPYLSTHTVTTYAHRDEVQRYLIGRVARTTSYEILNDGSQGVFALQASILDGSAARRLIGQTLHFYDGPAFQGLPFGQIGDHGVVARTESLVLTEEILQEAHKSTDTVQKPAEIPPYLVPGGASPWTTEYPQEFRDLLPPLAGYIFQPGGSDSPHARGYFVATARQHFDCQDVPGSPSHGLLKASRDPLGGDTTISYDRYGLLPTAATDPAGLTTSAVYDYRVLQAREVTDPNGNRRAYAFTPLGLLEDTAVMGKTGATVGDTLDVPSIYLVYDLLAFSARQQPVSVRTTRRVHHVNDTDVPLPERDETIETIEYSDGFGRLLQTRTQAEDITFGDAIFGDAGLPADLSLPVGPAVGRQRPPCVVVSGWQIYNNKGQVVEKYEPFFATGFDYTPPAKTELGQKSMMSYDPRGQMIRTVNPDGSEQRVVFGIPVDMVDPGSSPPNPASFTPTPWDTYTYDANDNAGYTQHTADPTHWNTPTSSVVDALGRTIETVERNGSNPTSDWHITRSTYDIRGNLLTVTDALGRRAFQYLYDLTPRRAEKGEQQDEDEGPRVLRLAQLDAGVKRNIFDATGNEIEQRDSKGALVLQAHDALNRPMRLWARDANGEALTLRARFIYGDSADSGLTFTQAQAANLLGALHQHYDEAGLLTFAAYDFQGKFLEKERQVIRDAQILSVFEPAASNNWQVQAFRINWQPPQGTTLSAHASTLLDPTVYRTSARYDALSRIKVLRYPHDAHGVRQELRPHYNHAGALERVELHGSTYVEHIAYNAKGQRILIAYGNGVLTRYAYEPQTFRLVRLRTERYMTPEAYLYQPTGTPLQDIAYQHDPAGNLVALHDRTPNSGIPGTPLGSSALDRTFTYDPLYRLLSATGRECDLSPAHSPWDARLRCADLTRVRGYTQQYTYDAAGNLLQLRHQASEGGFTRQLTLAPESNRLQTVGSGQTAHTYTYDACGNLLQETSSRHFEWNHRNQMKVFRIQAGTAEPSIHTHYFYDGDGQRVKKLVRKQGGQVEATIYVDDLFEHHRVVQAATTLEHHTLHVKDDEARVAQVRTGSPFPGDGSPAVQYHVNDHLGSSNLVVNEDGSFINREEYTPYGETCFGSFASKRYRFTGKERDAESGLSYHGARYFAPWLGRWISIDPAGRGDGLNPYQYVHGNPLRYQDPDGLEAKSPAEKFQEFLQTKVHEDQLAAGALSYCFGVGRNSAGRLTGDMGLPLAEAAKKTGIPYTVLGLFREAGLLAQFNKDVPKMQKAAGKEPNASQFIMTSRKEAWEALQKGAPVVAALQRKDNPNYTWHWAVLVRQPGTSNIWVVDSWGPAEYGVYVLGAINSEAELSQWHYSSAMDKTVKFDLEFGYWASGKGKDAQANPVTLKP